MSDSDEIKRLRQQNDALHEQVKLLVQLDRRLFRYQLEADRQLQRILAVNQFTLDAAATVEPAEIHRLGMRMLLSIVPMDQAVGLGSFERGALRPLVVHAQPGLESGSAEQLAAAASLHAIDALHLPPTPQIFTGATRPLAGPLAGLVDLLHALYGTTPATAPGALYVVIPLHGQRNTPLGAIALRKLEPEVVSIHDALPSEDDVPFLQLVGRHIGSALQTAMLHNELTAFAAELERRVEERTAELARANQALDANTTELQRTQDQLLHAGKMAAVGTLVAGLSHELNNPITVILGFAQGLLRQTAANDPSRSPLEAIARQARRCADLVNALLEFSRKQPMARHYCQVDALMRGAVNLARTKARARGVELTIPAAPASLPPLYVCATEVESALLNLVNNAIDASAKGGRVRLVATPASHNDRQGVEFCVEDEGTGIPAHHLSRIFDPFFTTKPVGQGTGLGLSLTRKIVESHGGTIAIDSEAERGTRILVWLPVLSVGPPTTRATE